MLIPISEITIGPGRREALSGDVKELANSIAEVGLINPIMVDQAHTLIAGLHRLEAMKLLGRSEIECTVSDLDGLQAALAEIDENFVRKDLSDDEFRELLLRRKEIYESLHPETKATYDGGAFRGNQHQKVVAAKNAATTKSFIQDTAEKTGKSPRTIRQAIQTTKNMTPEAKTIIRDADVKITKTNALKLSRLAPEQQEEAARQLAAGAIRSVDEYHPAPVESGPAEEQAPKLSAPPEDADSPALGTGYYPTIRDSVADLKDPDKDRSLTPDTFLMTFSLFLQRFCQSVRSYAVNEYEPVFPDLTRGQLDRLRQEISSAHTALDDLFTIIERTAKNE